MGQKDYKSGQGLQNWAKRLQVGVGQQSANKINAKESS